MVLKCFRWGDCSQPTQVQVTQLLAEFRYQLGGRLIGVYLHGSLATGCFNFARSDIDLLTITRHRLSGEAKKQLIETLLRISKSPHPVEISFLCFDDLHPWRYPPPFDLHYSEDWREQFALDLEWALERVTRFPVYGV